jgi:uncharacterized protein YpmB
MRFKRGQSAIEFAVIFGFVLFFFIVFFAIIQENQSDKNKEKERLIIQNIALDVQDEINLAAGSSEGYYREFTIPQNILGKDYDIQIIGEKVYANTSDFGVSYSVFEVQGNLVKGQNTIKKENEKVYLNQ